MPEEQTAPSADLPPPQPIVADPVPAAHPPAEIHIPGINRLNEVTVTRSEVRKKAETDKCVLNLLGKLAEAKAAETPSRMEIDAQKKAVAMAAQRYNRLLSLHEKKKATIQLIEAQLFQRLTTIQEREEAAKIRRIRGKMRPVFREALESAVNERS